MAVDDSEVTTIGALLARDGGSVKTGPFGTTLKAKEYSNEGVPLISVGEVGYGSLRVHASTPRAPREVVDRLPEYVLQAGDIVFGRKGAVDRSAIVKPEQTGWFLGSDGIRLRLPPTCEARFIAYQLQSHDARSWLLQHATGTTMASLNQNTIERLPVVLPPLFEQRSIARILGALDDRIELHRRMSRTLEEMAQGIFKSWFVDFDGYDDVVDSDLGPIPRGWTVKAVTALIEFNPKVRLERGAVAPFADMKALPTDGAIADEVTTRPFTGGGAKFCQGDTLLARITPCLENGKTALVDFLKQGEPGFGSTEFIVMRGRPEVSAEFVYCMARSETFRAHAITHMTGSSGRQRVQGDAFEHFPVAVPPPERLQEFAAVAEPMFRKISANVRESRTLTELRDTLLPKLISGELRVAGVEGLV